MAANSTIDTNSLFKAVEAVCFTIGPAVTAYFLSNFTVDSYGYYYRDMEGGIAFGVLIIAAGFSLRYWRTAK
ncbi:MAG: hypothetical protein ACE5FV_02815 [Woeseia sp.]